ncbi:MAG: glutamate--tRNA ligase, partial [Nanoarchaeota archaeon]|nr:glutamate--tRNA ligase [Nanoarchaeota archaeon]
SLYFFNKEIIDPSSDRYFFVENPVEVVVEGAPEQNVELDLYPEKKKRGRKFSTKDQFYLAQSDIDGFKDKEFIRLMDCLNLRKDKTKLVFDSVEYEKFKDIGKKIIHWLPAEKKDDLLNVEVLMPDGTSRKGLGESSMAKLKVGDIVQLERFGFARLDEAQGNKLVFWFAHK